MAYLVYIHTNKTNGKKYVGITNQKAYLRWNHGRGYRPETYFRRAIEKYGWDNFEHEIVFEGLTELEAKAKEMELIAFHRTFIGFDDCHGYNMTLGGEGTIGVIRSEEYRQKQRIAQSGKKLAEDTKQRISENSARRQGAVLQFDKNGEFIREWDCMTAAMKALHTNHIPDVCRGRRKTAGGFIWKLKEAV